MLKYIILSIGLFIIGLYGMFISRKHLIVTLMALELVLLAANINFVAFSIYLDNLIGQLNSLLILTVGAAESAIGLGILIIYYRLRGSLAIDLINVLKG